MIRWIYFPKSDRPPQVVREVVAVFEAVSDDIDSTTHTLDSNAVLSQVRPGLEASGFRVETGKTRSQKIAVPVLFGHQGQIEKSFDADAYHPDLGVVLEVEAGRGVVNNQFLKDLFQACMMHGVKYFAVAVRNIYKNSRDFERVVLYFDTLYASNRLSLPLDGILIIGYYLASQAPALAGQASRVSEAEISPCQEATNESPKCRIWRPLGPILLNPRLDPRRAGPRARALRRSPQSPPISPGSGSSQIVAREQGPSRPYSHCMPRSTKRCCGGSLSGHH
jgi:hypothetical protein